MAHGSAHPAQAHHPDTRMRAITWILSILGVFAAAIGVWIVVAPTDGTISVFGSSWTAGELTDTWQPWLLIVGGGVAGVGMAVAAVRDWEHGANRWLVTAEALLSVAGVAAAFVGISMLT